MDAALENGTDADLKDLSSRAVISNASARSRMDFHRVNSVVENGRRQQQPLRKSHTVPNDLGSEKNRFQAVDINEGKVAVRVEVGSQCPECRQGTLEESYSGVGIALAILLFPIGLICCLFMKRVHCTQCKFMI